MFLYPFNFPAQGCSYRWAGPFQKYTQVLIQHGVFRSEEEPVSTDNLQLQHAITLQLHLHLVIFLLINPNNLSSYFKLHDNILCLTLTFSLII